MFERVCYSLDQLGSIFDVYKEDLLELIDLLFALLLLVLA